MPTTVPQVTRRQLDDAILTVQRELREVEDAFDHQSWALAYRAANRAEHAAFDLKDLFAVDVTALPCA